VIVGEVRWIDLPTRGGRAQAGRRPAIIVQSISADSCPLLYYIFFNCVTSIFIMLLCSVREHNSFNATKWL
jgi:hypothetical protein